MGDRGLEWASASTRHRIAAYLDTLTLGVVFTKADLRAAVGGDGEEQFGRRMRDLREYGWVINTYREEEELNPREHRLMRYGTIPPRPDA